MKFFVDGLRPPRSVGDDARATSTARGKNHAEAHSSDRDGRGPALDREHLLRAARAGPVHHGHDQHLVCRSKARRSPRKARTRSRRTPAPGHVILHPSNLDAFPKKDTLPRDRVGQRRLRDRQQGLLAFLTTVASHGFLVIGTAADRRRAAAPGECRRSAHRDRLGGQGEQARRLAAQGQDRGRKDSRDGQLVRRLPLDRPGRRPAREDDRRVQLRA